MTAVKHSNIYPCQDEGTELRSILAYDRKVIELYFMMGGNCIGITHEGICRLASRMLKHGPDFWTLDFRKIKEREKELISLDPMNEFPF